MTETVTTADVAPEELTLDQRITAALETDDNSSEFLGALYNELDVAAGVAEQTARECRSNSLDPLYRDGVAARGRAEDNEFIAQRLRNAAPPLLTKCRQAKHREHTAWNKSAEEVEDLVRRTAHIFCKTYSDAVRELVGTFKLVADVDRRVIHLNSTAPDGVMKRLPTIEAALGTAVPLPQPLP